jgi:hypothetical protein
MMAIIDSAARMLTMVAFEDAFGSSGSENRRKP